MKMITADTLITGPAWLGHLPPGTKIDWPFSTFHRDVQAGLYQALPPPDLSCGERR